MYNGNISWMETDLKLFKKPQAMLYKYDQLNRITKSRSLEFSNGNYATRTGDKKYDENYSYDANGNILTLKRHDDKAALTDDFNYSYYANSNKLLKHKTTGGTYEYDAIGNLVKDNNENLQIAWTPSGKVRSVTKRDSVIHFRYDATGNRIAKIVSTTAKKDTTIYVRDASGNVMTIYRNRAVSEVPIYGSSRIGEYMGKEKEGYQTFNLRKYELSNHLGNVLVVISDKVKLYSRNKITLDSARAEVVSASDYYPFGLAMKGREFSSSTYRYGFNGKENDVEFGWQDYGARMYMQRIGRFPSIDPLAYKYSFQSPYAYAINNPIKFVDINGKGPGDGILGFLVGALDNLTANVFNIRGRAGKYVSHGGEVDFNQGLDAADIGSIVIGADLMTGGAVAAEGGVLATAASGGLLAEVGVPVAAAGAGAVVVGGTLITTGAANLAKQNGRLNAEGKPNPKREAREKAKEIREQQPASEKRAKDYARDLEKREGKDARREAHDAKDKTGKDRTVKELKENYKIKD